MGLFMCSHWLFGIGVDTSDKGEHVFSYMDATFPTDATRTDVPWLKPPDRRARSATAEQCSGFYAFPVTHSKMFFTDRSYEMPMNKTKDEAPLALRISYCSYSSSILRHLNVFRRSIIRYLNNAVATSQATPSSSARTQLSREQKSCLSAHTLQTG